MVLFIYNNIHCIWSKFVEFIINVYRYIEYSGGPGIRHGKIGSHLSPLKKYVLPTSSHQTAASMLCTGIPLLNMEMSCG